MSRVVKVVFSELCLFSMLSMAFASGCGKTDYTFAHYDAGITFAGTGGMIHKVVWHSPNVPVRHRIVEALNDKGGGNDQVGNKVPRVHCPITVHLALRDLGDSAFSSINEMRQLGGEKRNERDGAVEIALLQEGFWIVASYQREELVGLSVLVSREEPSKKEVSVDRKRIPLPLPPNELFRLVGEPRSYEVQ
jgi:hypothetical protein